MPAMTLVNLQDLFHEVTRQIFPALAAGLIRPAFQQQGQPGVNVPDSVIYIHIENEAQYWDKLRQITTARIPGNEVEGKETTLYTRVMRVDWYLYGPSSFDNADILRTYLLSEPIREFLNLYNVAPIRDINPGRRAPEMVNGQWRERTDLSALFNVATTRDATRPYFAEAAITVNAGGDEQTVEISQ